MIFKNKCFMTTLSFKHYSFSKFMFYNVSRYTYFVIQLVCSRKKFRIKLNMIQMKIWCFHNFCMAHHENEYN